MSKIRVRYQTYEFDATDIHIRSLRDKQEFDYSSKATNLGVSEASWPLFGVVWPSGEVLAHLMFEFNIEGKRILELGCGLGLASLVLNNRFANITATDYNPDAQTFLEENVKLNKGDLIPFFRADWAKKNEKLGKYDLIIGSDLLYERNQINDLSSFINKHANDSCEVVIIDPGRGNYNKFTKEMTDNGYDFTDNKVKNCDYLEKLYNGRVLYYTK